MRRAAAGDPDLGAAGAQSAVTIGSQALPLTGVADQLELNVRARPAVPKRHQNSIPLPRPGGQALAVPRPQALCPGDDDQLDPFESLAPSPLLVSASPGATASDCNSVASYWVGV
jgi:hypothetical protein